MGFFGSLFGGRKPGPEPAPPPSPTAQTLALDDEGVRLLRDGAVEQQVRWADLVEVGVLTSDEGPFGEDFWLMLLGTEQTGCAVPGEIAGFAALRDRVFKLPGFDLEKWIEACGSTENARFVCWTKGG